MTKETPLKNSEILNESSPVMIVIEDSSFYGKIHQRYLKDLGVETVILHGIGNFDEGIAEIKKTENIAGVITDCLHGNWVSVYQASINNDIKNVWLITGNQDIMKESRNYPYVTAMNKASLHQNPEIYKLMVGHLAK